MSAVAAIRRGCVAALAATLLVPAGALADTATSTPGKRGFVVSFNVSYNGNKPKEVTRFRFKSVTIQCESGGPPNPFTTHSLAPHFGPMSVNGQGRFGRVFANNGNRFNGKVVIHGEFQTKRKVEGTLKIKGDYPNDGYENCTSGRLDWNATVG